MDIVVDELIIEEDRPVHIAKHSVTIDEVYEIVFGDYATDAGKEGRILLIGKTSKQRWITVIIGKRIGKNKYGLVTARDVKKKEKLLYQRESKGEK